MRTKKFSSFLKGKSNSSQWATSTYSNPKQFWQRKEICHSLCFRTNHQCFYLMMTNLFFLKAMAFLSLLGSQFMTKVFLLPWLPNTLPRKFRLLISLSSKRQKKGRKTTRPIAPMMTTTSAATLRLTEPWTWACRQVRNTFKKLQTPWPSRLRSRSEKSQLTGLSVVCSSTSRSTVQRQLLEAEKKALSFKHLMVATK